MSGFRKPRVRGLLVLIRSIVSLFQLEFYMYEKTISVARKYGSRVAAVPALAVVAMGSAHAALPTSVSTAITEYQTDATTAIGLIMAAGVVIWGLMRLASKLGWR